MSRLIDLFNQLTLDPFARQEFTDNPDETVAAAGLSPADIPGPKSDALFALGTALQSGPWARGACWGDPGPDPLDAHLPDGHDE